MLVDVIRSERGKLDRDRLLEISLVWASFIEIGLLMMVDTSRRRMRLTGNQHHPSSLRRCCSPTSQEIPHGQSYILCICSCLLGSYIHIHNRLVTAKLSFHLSHAELPRVVNGISKGEMSSVCCCHSPGNRGFCDPFKTFRILSNQCT